MIDTLNLYKLCTKFRIANIKNFHKMLANCNRSELSNPLDSIKTLNSRSLSPISLCRNLYV